MGFNSKHVNSLILIIYNLVENRAVLLEASSLFFAFLEYLDSLDPDEVTDVVRHSRFHLFMVVGRFIVG
jgi:hypothetical protein